MQKNIKITSILAAVTAATVIAATAQASDGVITFNGAITATTCSIATGGNGSFTVNLPTVQTTAFSGPGKTAGNTGFTIDLANCTPNSGNVRAFFEMGPTVDTTTNGLLNSNGTATNVEVQLLDNSNAVIAVGADAQDSGPFAIGADGSAHLVYSAQYLSTNGVPTAGSVSTTVTYSLNYN